MATQYQNFETGMVVSICEEDCNPISVSGHWKAVIGLRARQSHQGPVNPLFCFNIATNNPCTNSGLFLCSLWYSYICMPSRSQVTWNGERNGRVMIYVDGVLTKAFDTNKAGPLPGGGILVLGNEQGERLWIKEECFFTGVLSFKIRCQYPLKLSGTLRENGMYSVSVGTRVLVVIICTSKFRKTRKLGSWGFLKELPSARSRHRFSSS
jgi:hypothetical protein